MSLRAPRAGFRQAALERLAALAPLDERSTIALQLAIGEASEAPPRRELLKEGQEITQARLMVSGWAARVRLLPDGRRQLLSFVLPGDLIGICNHERPVALSSVVSLTDVATCAAPSGDVAEDLQRVYDLSRAFEEAYLLSQITRLGRLSAHERLGDLFLELHERLGMCGLAVDGSFSLPLTQETMADALGLTPVHLNRTLQTARRLGELEWRSGRATLKDPDALAERVGRMPVRVSASRARV